MDDFIFEENGFETEEMDFPEKDKRRAKKRKASVREKFHKAGLIAIEALRKPGTKEIKTSKVLAERKAQKHSERQSAKNALRAMY